MIYKINLKSLDDNFDAIFVKVEKDRLDKMTRSLMVGLFGMIEKEANYRRHIFKNIENELK